jgi:hypothetical protein
MPTSVATIYNAIYALAVGELLSGYACARSRRRAGRTLAAWIGAARSLKW